MCVLCPPSEGVKATGSAAKSISIQGTGEYFWLLGCCSDPQDPQMGGRASGSREPRRKADAQSSEHPRGRSPLPSTNSPGLDDPSLIRIGLAKFTRIVLPKSSDSFCRGEKKQNKAHQKVKKKKKKITVPPKSLTQRSEENRACFLYVAHTTQGLGLCCWEDGKAAHLPRRVGRGSVPCCQ